MPVQSAQVALQSAQMTLHSAQVPLHSAHMTLQPAQVPLHSAQMTLHLAQVPLHSAQVTLHVAQVPSQSAQMTLHSAQVPLQFAETGDDAVWKSLLNTKRLRKMRTPPGAAQGAPGAFGSGEPTASAPNRNRAIDPMIGFG